MVLDNICHLLNNFLACTAYQNVVFCWVLHQQDIWDTILGAAASGGLRGPLRCPDCQRSRPAAEAGSGCRRRAAHADVIPRSLARLPLYTALSARNIDTTGKTPAEVAAEIVQSQADL